MGHGILVGYGIYIHGILVGYGIYWDMEYKKELPTKRSIASYKRIKRSIASYKRTIASYQTFYMTSVVLTFENGMFAYYTLLYLTYTFVLWQSSFIAKGRQIRHINQIYILHVIVLYLHITYYIIIFDILHIIFSCDRPRLLPKEDRFTMSTNCDRVGISTCYYNVRVLEFLYVNRQKF